MHLSPNAVACIMRTKHSGVQDGRAHSARYWRVYSKSVRDGEREGSGLALPHPEITSLLTVKQDSLDEAPFDYAQDRLRLRSGQAPQNPGCKAYLFPGFHPGYETENSRPDSIPLPPLTRAITYLINLDAASSLPDFSGLPPSVHAPVFLNLAVREPIHARCLLLKPTSVA